MDYTSYLNDYSDDLRRLTLEKQRQREHEFDKLIQKAEQSAADAGRAGYLDFRNYTNPYGVQAEALTQRGLDKSGLSETNRTKAYNSYQNRIAQANKTAAESKDRILAQKIGAQLENEESELSAQDDLHKRMYDQYWKDKEWEYRLGRDRLEDARAESEWQYKLSQVKKAGSAGSSSKSSGSKVSSPKAPVPLNVRQIEKVFSAAMDYVKGGGMKQRGAVDSYIGELKALGADGDMLERILNAAKGRV